MVSPLEGWARQSRDGSTVQEDSALDLGLKGQLPPWSATPAGDVPVGSTVDDEVWLGTGPLSALGAERPGGPQAPCLMTFPGIRIGGSSWGSVDTAHQSCYLLSSEPDGSHVPRGERPSQHPRGAHRGRLPVGLHPRLGPGSCQK